MLTLAEAEKRRLELEALGRAESIRAEGLAEAEVIRAKGEAEAIAMARKASAFHEYNQAAIVDKLLSELPEIVRALAEPLTKVDKITVVSTGSDGARGVGINQLTTDMAQVIAQVPALVETLTGLKLEELMRRLPQLRDSAAASMPTSARTDGKEQ